MAANQKEGLFCFNSSELIIAWSLFVFNLGPTYTLFYRHEKMHSFISELPHCCPSLALCIIDFRSHSQGFHLQDVQVVCIYSSHWIPEAWIRYTYNSIRALTSLKKISFECCFFVHYYIMSGHNTSATNYSNLETVSFSVQQHAWESAWLN